MVNGEASSQRPTASCPLERLRRQVGAAGRVALPIEKVTSSSLHFTVAVYNLPLYYSIRNRPNHLPCALFWTKQPASSQVGGHLR